MTQKWNLQDIRPTGAGKPAMREVPVRRPQQDIVPRQTRITQNESIPDPDLGSIDIIDGNDAKKKRVITTVVIASIIIGLGFVVNIMLGGADVTVYPKTKNISVQANLNAYKNPAVDMLGYELLTLETTGEKQVKASGKEKVSMMCFA